MAENKKENKAWKITSLVLNIIFYLFIAILLIFSISNLGMKSDLGIPGLFGNGYLTVQTNSMDSNKKDSFSKNDLIFVDIVTDKNRDKKLAKIEIGDIITFDFHSSEVGRLILNTHRVVDIRTVDGKKMFVTQGDKVAEDPMKRYEPNANPEDKAPDYVDYYENVAAEDVKAIYTGKWSGVGKAMKFIQQPNGFLICIVLPTALFFIFEAIMLVLNFTKIKSHKKEQATEAAHNEEMANMKAELEAEREKMRLEILAEMEAKKEVEEDSKENNEETKEE